MKVDSLLNPMVLKKSIDNPLYDLCSISFNLSTYEVKQLLPVNVTPVEDKWRLIDSILECKKVQELSTT